MLLSKGIRLIFLTLALFTHTAWTEPVLPGSPEDNGYQAPPISYTRRRQPPLTREVQDKWMAEFFEGPEIWYFRSETELHNLLDAASLNEDVRKEFEVSFKPRMTTEETIKATNWLPSPANSDGFIPVPRELRAKLSHDFLQAMYEHQLRLVGKTPLAIQKNSEDEFFRVLNDRMWRLSRKQREEVRKNLFTINGKLNFFITPATWDLLPPSIRKETIEFTTSGIQAQGIDPFITIHPADDVEAIGRFFAGERNPAVVIRYLQMLKRRNPEIPFEVPLEKILHPFIRKMVDTYSLCHGPNCFDAGRNVSLGNSYRPEFLSSGEELEADLKTRFQLAKHGDRYRPGDLLVYETPYGKLVHVAAVAGDGLVFTKNGMSKTSPYLFQERTVMERVYFPDGRFKVRTYRGLAPEIIEAVARSRSRCHLAKLATANPKPPTASEAGN